MNLETLKWQVAMGADEAVGEEPVVKVSENDSTPAANAPAPQKNTVIPAQAGIQSNTDSAQSEVLAPVIRRGDNGLPNNTPPSSPSALEARARQLADAATTRDELREAIANFDGLAIQKTAKNMVFSDGNPAADIMFIGEAPGANEDETGVPFCGASGQLMDKAVAHIGLTRTENWYISNTIFWRPPGNRTPTREEVAICRPFVEKHIALIQPKVLVLVGGTAANSLMDDNKGISKLRGSFGEYSNHYLTKPIHMTAIFHPSFLLRSPGKKKDFWFDLLNLREFATQNGATL